MLAYQPKNSSECGIACLQSIMNFLGIKKTRIDIIHELNYDRIKDDGTHLPQLATYLLKNNINVKLIGRNPYIKIVNSKIIYNYKKNKFVTKQEYTDSIES